jgi:8-amino-7-oxononanoate synthase
LCERKVPIGTTQTPIVPVLCGENDKAFRLGKKLYDRGYLATGVIYPAVPAHMARLRLCVTAGMDDLLLNRFAQDLERSLSP